MKMNHTSIQKHLQLLNTLGISYVNLRTFSTLNKKTVSHIFSTADSQAIINYLEKQKLSEGKREVQQIAKRKRQKMLWNK